VISTNKANFEENLKKSGLKNTKHRNAVLNILQKSNQPIAAEQVYLQLKQKEIAINLSTVYRTLETLAEKQLATKIIIAGDSRALFEYNQMVHKHYLICLGCKKIISIHHCPLESYEQSLADETGYLIEGHRLDVYGYCPECQKKQ